jgi:hypothetical protein
VIGRPESETHQPTSGDVHLYADLCSRESLQPILYADCEGFGAKKSPVAATSTNDGARLTERLGASMTTGLKWAKRLFGRDAKNHRSFAVDEMFPRVLYAFSDVICFVHTEMRYIRIPQQMLQLTLY